MFDLDVAQPETEVTLMRRVAMITGASRESALRPHWSSQSGGSGWSSIIALAPRRRQCHLPARRRWPMRSWVRRSAGDKQAGRVINFTCLGVCLFNVVLL